MKDLRQFLFPTALASLLLPALFLLPGCSEEDHPALQLKDLTDGELLFVSRIVILERAKAVALIDRPTGEALLDSLAAAWGDSAFSETSRGVPSSPKRVGQVGDLLIRILDAELDSLISAPRPDRLAAPLPNPLPVEPEPEPTDPAAAK
jgi:hypothetical protein